MEYQVKVGPEEYRVSAESTEEGWTLSVGDGELDFKARAVNANQLSLVIDGRRENVFIATSDEGTWVWSRGRARLVTDASLAQRRTGRRAGPGEAPGKVTPPTPASVVEVLVAIGDHVTKGQPLVVVSAMKMETRLTAPFNGTVTAVNTEAGSQVAPGDILVDIEPDEEGEGQND